MANIIIFVEYLPINRKAKEIGIKKPDLKKTRFSIIF